MPKLARNDLIPHFAQSIARTPTRYAVEGVRGLFLYVSVRGKCTWFLRYQKGRGEKRRRRYRRIGDAAVMGLAEAVDRARNLIASPTAGRGTKWFERDPLRAATMTGAELVAEFLLHHVRAELSPATAKYYEYYLTGFVLPALGNRLAADVRQCDIISLIDAIAAEQVSDPRLAGRNATRSGGAKRLACRVRAVVSAIYGWADKRNILDINPMVGAATPARRQRPADRGRHVGRRGRSLAPKPHGLAASRVSDRVTS
jgi:hypothetical protein